jgi:hypothetical protein
MGKLWSLDFNNQQRHRDGEHGITERFKSGVGWAMGGRRSSLLIKRESRADGEERSDHTRAPTGRRGR